MTHREIEEIATIIMTADGGCRYCVRSLMRMLYDKFPRYVNTMLKVWNKEYQGSFLE